jgi:hypothetical protein
MKLVHEVYTVENHKYITKFSSEDISEAQEFLREHNTQHPEDEYKILSLYTYNKKEDNED